MVEEVADNVSTFVSFRYFFALLLQLEWIRQGFASVAPVELFDFLSAEQLHCFICGRPDIDVSRLQKNTIYSSGLKRTDRLVQGAFCLHIYLTLQTLVWINGEVFQSACFPFLLIFGSDSGCHRSTNIWNLADFWDVIDSFNQVSVFFSFFFLFFFGSLHNEGKGVDFE